MSTRPILMSLDTLPLPTLRDMMAARSSDLPRDQHALMSAYGGPEQVRGCYLFATASTIATYTMSLRVAPGVTVVGIGILISGNGTASFTTAAGGSSTFMSAVAYADEPSPENASRLFGGIQVAGDGEGNALAVRSSVAWDWTSVDITLTLTPNHELYVYELSFVPVHVPR